MHRSPKKGKSSKSSPNLSNNTSGNNSNITGNERKKRLNSTPPSPGSKLKSFLQRSLSSKSNNNNNNNNNNGGNTKTHSISSPFGFTHITHVDFDPDSQELCGLPKEWSNALQKSVTKMVTHRKDSTAMRTMEPFDQLNINDELTESPLIPPPFLLEHQDAGTNSNSNTVNSIVKDNTRKSSPPVNNNNNNNNNNQSTPNLSKTYHYDHTNTLSMSSNFNRKSSPIKFEIINMNNNNTSNNNNNSNTASTSGSNSASNSPSMLSEIDSLEISSPTYIRRDLHIAWNQDTGQFEGVPDEWQYLMSEVKNEKQRKKNMEMRKKLLLQESLLYDKEEKNRRIQRDKRERTRLLKDERRKSVYVERGKHDPIPIPRDQFNNGAAAGRSLISSGPSLWQISGTQILKTKRIAISMESICKNDVFILDSGKRIYVWLGEQSSLQKQVRACSIANKIKFDNQFILEPITITFIMEKFDTELEIEFFQFLSGYSNMNNGSSNKDHIVTRIGNSDDIIINEEEASTTWLYRVNENGKITVIEDRPLLPTFLTNNTCYILDCETDIFVWNGKYSHQLKQKAAIIFANEFLNIFSGRPSWASIHVVHQAEEPWFFKERFLYWLEDESIIDNTRRNTTVMRQTNQGSGIGGGLNNFLHPIPIPLDNNFHIGDLFNIPDLFQKSIQNNTSSEPLASTMMQHVSLDIWKSEGKSWFKVPSEIYGHFDSHRCYVCHQIFTIGGKFQSRVYFWQGSHAPIRWWIVFQFYLYKELSEHMLSLDAPPPPTECLTQSKESIGFLKLFKHIFIHQNPIYISNNSSTFTSTTDNTITNTDTISSLNSSFIPQSISNYSIASFASSSSFNSSFSNSNFFSNSKSILYQLSTIGNAVASRSVQFGDGFDISSLNSRDIFIFYSFSAKTMFIWYGKGSSKEMVPQTKKIAESIHQYYQVQDEILKTDSPLIVECEETQEPTIFWKLFFSCTCARNSDTYHQLMNIPSKRNLYVSNAYYCNSELNSSQQLRFFHIFYNPKIKNYVIMRINPFCQSDLCEEDTFLLDCTFKLFVWFGPSCSKKKREATELLANQYIDATNEQCELIYVEASNEPIEFKSYFQGWSSTQTLTSMKNNQQSLIGVEADHRIINSIVSSTNNDDNYHHFDSDDESGTGDSPINLSPTSSPTNNSILTRVNSDDIESMEPWEIDLLQQVETIQKDRGGNGNGHRNRTISSNSNSSNGSSNQHPHHLTSSTIHEHQQQTLSPLKYSSSNNFASDDSSETSTCDESNSESDEYEELKKPSMPKRGYQFTNNHLSISPASKNKLLELAHVNNVKIRKRGSSVLSKSPLNLLKQMKQKGNIMSPNHPHTGSIDAKSIQLLKDAKAFQDIDDEVEKMEYEISKLLDDNSNSEIDNYNNNNNNVITVNEKKIEIITNEIPLVNQQTTQIVNTSNDNCKNIQKSDIVNSFNDNVNNIDNNNKVQPKPPNPKLSIPLKKVIAKAKPTAKVSPRSINNSNNSNNITPRSNITTPSDKSAPSSPKQQMDTIAPPTTTTTTTTSTSTTSSPSSQPISPRLLLQKKIINNMMANSSVGSSNDEQPITPKPIVIQRSLSTKELINNAETLIKNLSEQAQKSSPRPLNRSASNLNSNTIKQSQSQQISNSTSKSFNQ